MTGSVPWSVSAVDPDTWAAAREAARRAGLSVGEWLETAIRDNAHTLKPRGRSGGRAAADYRLEDLYERIDLLLSRNEAVPRYRDIPVQPAQPNQYVTSSLDALTNRIDTLLRGMERNDRNGGQDEIASAIRKLDGRIESLFAAPPREHNDEVETKLNDIARVVEAMSQRLERETAQIASPSIAPTAFELDEAVADIIERQAMLDGVSYRRPQQQQHAQPQAQGLPIDLERRLKHIADEMESLRRSNSRTEPMQELRRDIAELSRTMADLAPRRTLEALENTVDALARRIDRTPSQTSHEANMPVLAALDDIRDALAQVRPAESFASVEGDLNTLSKKLDVINAKSIDGTTVARIQTQISELRELLSSALPGEALQSLVGQIETMASKVERANADGDGGVRDVVSGLERRIDALVERIETPNQTGAGSEALDRIGSRLDNLQQTLGSMDRNPMGLEATMRSLVERLDASEAKLSGLSTIERGISDLSEQFDKARANAMEVAERAAKTALRELSAARGQGPMLQNAPAIVPSESQSGRPLAGEVLSVTAMSPRVESMPEPTPRVARAVPAMVVPRAGEVIATDGLPADYPLEPGSGAPRSRSTPVAQRIAQSEAAVADITPRPNETNPRTSDYIAAARRAAQAAASETNEAATQERKAGAIQSIFSRGRRALLLGLAVAMLGFSAVRFFDIGAVTNFFGGEPHAPTVEQSVPVPPAQPAAPPAAPSDPEQQSNTLPGAIDPAVAAIPTSGIIAPETTGSFLTHRPITAAPSAPPQRPVANLAANPVSERDLPPSIGNQALRNAAAKGDPDAAYEIAERYVAGRGVTADAAQALKWFERAAAKGSASAAFRLGMAYEKGIGVAKSRTEAQTFYTLAADSGHVKAMHNLAVLIVEIAGYDGKPDYAAAIPWFRKAAGFGLRDSQYNLGVLYARGLGVTQNLTESFHWFSLAANQGDPDAAKKRDDVAARLDNQTLAAAKLAVQSWSAQSVNADANIVRLKPEWQKSAIAPKKSPAKQPAKK